MDTQVTANGSADPVEERTAGMDVESLVLALLAAEATKAKNHEESHEDCGSRLLFTPWSGIIERPDIATITTVPKLRLGVAAACQSCTIVLDAITSYSSGRIPLCSIVQVSVAYTQSEIRVLYRLASDPGDESRLREARLELFRLKNESDHNLQITDNDTLKKLHVHAGNLPSGDTSSEQALQTLYDWIGTCVDHHGTCAGRKVVQLPKRVLEIDGKYVYLRERFNTPAVYACLSHCWGSTGPTMKLDKTSSGRLMDGVAIDQLPKTFADSVHLCTKLGIRFIWIDACCIMQDDKDDWEEAAATMANIYEQSYITIAATSASNSDCGLFAMDRKEYQSRKLRDCELYVRRKHQFFPSFISRPFSFSEDFPLLTRAWVFQERLLSSRMVHFGKDQIYWQCRTLFMTEGGSACQERYPGAGGYGSYTFMGFHDDPVRRWHEVVTTYSGLNLTYESDRLPAVAAIVEREMRWRKDDTYIAGMWTSSLIADLAWRADGYSTLLPRPRLPNPVPTWSWPSSKVHVRWDSDSILPSLRLVDLSYTRVGPAHIGGVANASITLEGPTCMVQLKRIYDPRSGLFEPSMELESLEAHTPGEVRTDFDWTTGDRPVMIGDTFLVVPIQIQHRQGRQTYSLGLILREIANGNFERMGAIYIRPLDHGTAILSLGKLHRILLGFIEALPIRQVKIT